MTINVSRAAGFLAACAASAILVGCASTDSLTQTKSAADRAEAMAQVAAQPMAPADVSPIQVKDSVYVSAYASRNERGDPLPGNWDKRSFNVGRARLASFQEIANAITEQTGIPVAVTAINSGSVTTVATRAPGGPGNMPPIGVGPAPNALGDPALAGALGALQGQGSGTAIRATEPPTGDLGITGRMQVRHEGNFPQFLDLVATNFNVAWTFKEGRIVFQRYITRTFEVPALPTVSSLAFSMKSGSDSSRNGGGSGGGTVSGSTGSAMQEASTKSSFDMWKDLDETVKGMMAREGGYAQVSAQKGSVTVTASPSAVRNVQDYLRTLNQQLAKQVAINVKVYSVILTDGDNYSSDINLLLQDRFAGTSIVKSALAISSGGASAPGAALPVTQSGANQGIGWAILNNGRYSGSNGVANLLSQKGDVSVVTSASATALNGQPVPVQVANTRGYAAEVQSVLGGGTVAGAGTQTTIKPGSVTTGFNLHLVPKIQRDNTIMMQYGLNVSELVGNDNGFDTFTTGGQTIQLPNINQRNFIQQAIIPNASTLVLAGFEQVRSSSIRSGQGQSWLWPLGGQANSQLRREILVVAITPTIVDVSSPASRIPADAVVSSN